MSKQLESRKRRFEELFDSHGSVLLGMLRRMARNSHDVDEVFQETALRVWKNVDQMPRIRSPRAWLMTIGYRAFLDYQTRRVNRSELDDRPDCRQASPDMNAERDEAIERANATIAGLPESIREVVVLHYSGGLSLRQTAAAIGVPVGTVKSRLNQALGILRKACHEV